MRAYIAIVILYERQHTLLHVVTPTKVLRRTTPHVVYTHTHNVIAHCATSTPAQQFPDRGPGPASHAAICLFSEPPTARRIPSASLFFSLPSLHTLRDPGCSSPLHSRAPPSPETRGAPSCPLFFGLYVPSTPWAFHWFRHRLFLHLSVINIWAFASRDIAYSIRLQETLTIQ